MNICKCFICEKEIDIEEDVNQGASIKVVTIDRKADEEYAYRIIVCEEHIIPMERFTRCAKEWLESLFMPNNISHYFTQEQSQRNEAPSPVRGIHDA